MLRGDGILVLLWSNAWNSIDQGRPVAVRWTDNAINHFSTIYEYIAMNSPMYAKQMVDKISRRSQQIVNQPLSGRKVP